MLADNAGAQLLRCIAEFRHKDLVQRPIFPTGAAFQEHGWRPTAGQVREFLTVAEQTCPGCNFWVWENTRRYPDLWEVIQLYDWANTPVPPPTPPASGLRLRVKTEGLRIRNGPGTGFADIGRLSAGEIVDLENLDGADVWVKHKRGWSAMRHGGSRHMEVD